MTERASMKPPLLPTVLALTAFTAIFASTRAAAAFERQWHAGGGLGIRPTSIAGASAQGVAPLFVANLTYGLTDSFDAFAEIGVAYPGFTRGVEPSRVLTATGDLGVVYTLDVLRVVPYLGIFGGVHHIGALPLAAPDGTVRDFGGTGLDLGAAFGARYQWDRTLAFGADLRYHRPLFLPDTTQAMGLFVSAAYTWGY